MDIPHFAFKVSLLLNLWNEMQHHIKLRMSMSTTDTSFRRSSGGRLPGCKPSALISFRKPLWCQSHYLRGIMHEAWRFTLFLSSLSMIRICRNSKSRGSLNYLVYECRSPGHTVQTSSQWMMCGIWACPDEALMACCPQWCFPGKPLHPHPPAQVLHSC